MILKIITETWGKCGIKRVKYYNEKENTIELWNKTCDIEIQLGH